MNDGRESKVFATLCGRIFRGADPQYFPSAVYNGKIIRLCTEACLGAFLADPDLFYKAHRSSPPGTAARAFKERNLEVENDSSPQSD